MKSSFKRRSAFSIYQSQLKKEDEDSQKEQEKVVKTPGSKKRRHEENSSSRASIKKVSKLDRASSKSLNGEAGDDESFDHEEHTPEMAESKQRGKGTLLSKANKLRQSLTLSSRKKKIRRNGYQSYDRGLEKSTSNITVHSLPEKADCKSDSELLHSEVEQDDRVKLDQDETEADKLFSWLISPVKPKKFFRYRLHIGYI